MSGDCYSGWERPAATVAGGAVAREGLRASPLAGPARARRARERLARASASRSLHCSSRAARMPYTESVPLSPNVQSVDGVDHSACLAMCRHTDVPSAHRSASFCVPFVPRRPSCTSATTSSAASRPTSFRDSRCSTHTVAPAHGASQPTRNCHNLPRSSTTASASLANCARISGCKNVEHLSLSLWHICALL